MPLKDTRGRPAGRHGGWWLRRIAGVGAGVVLALVVTAGPALAHADLVSSSPANEARLTAEPQQVVLVFSENVEIGLSAITVVAPDGRRVAGPPLRRLRGQGNTLTASLRADPAHGTYVLDWRTVASDDGHVTAGGLTFSVGAPTRVAPGSAAGTGTPGGTQASNIALQVVTGLAFAGFALLTGCAAVRLACLPPGTPAGNAAVWPAAAGWLILLVATLAQLLLYGPYTAGLGPAHLFDRSLLGTTVPTHLGHALMIRIGLLALFPVLADQAMRRAATARPRRWSMAAVALLAVGLAATWSATSHAASGTLATVALPVATAHVAAMGVWAGGLFTLGVCLLRPAVAMPAGSGRQVAGPVPAGPGSAGPGSAGPGPADGKIMTLVGGAGGPPAETAVATTTPAAGMRAEDVAGLRIAVTRFSTLALASVITLVLTGAYLAVREVGRPGALTGTSYGRLVLVKAAGLIVIIAVASRSRRYVRRRLGDGIGGLRRTVLVELAGVGLLLAVATMLVNTAPPRAGGQSPPTPSTVAPAAPGALGPGALGPGALGPGALGPGALGSGALGSGSAAVPPEDAVRGWLRPVPGSEPAAAAGRGRTPLSATTASSSGHGMSLPVTGPRGPASRMAGHATSARIRGCDGCD